MTGFLKQLQDRFLADLEGGLRPLGFLRVARTATFRRLLGGGLGSLRIGFVKHASDLDVVASISVRINSVEELLVGCDSRRPKDGFTLGAQLGSIVGSGQMRWSLDSLGSISNATESFVDAVKSIAIPYVDKYIIEGEALSVLRGDDSRAWIHSPMHAERAQKALALAFLCGDPIVFDRVYSEKKEYLSQRSDPGLSAFLDLYACLVLRRGSRQAK